MVLPDNNIGPEGATALAEALGKMQSLSLFDLSRACFVLRCYVLVVGPDMKFLLSVLVVYVSGKVCIPVVVSTPVISNSDPHG